jgi:hypothetical protein
VAGPSRGTVYVRAPGDVVNRVPVQIQLEKGKKPVEPGLWKSLLGSGWTRAKTMAVAAVAIVVVAAVAIAAIVDPTPPGPGPGDGRPRTEMVLEWGAATLDESGPPPAVINGITATGGQLVAGGVRESKAATWVLRDDEWQAVPNPSSAPGEEVITGITPLAGQFVAVGASRTSDGMDAAAWWVSLDGELSPIDDFALPGDQVINKVLSLKDVGLIAAGQNEGDGAVWFSETGDDWMLEPDDANELGGPGEQALSRIAPFKPKGSTTRMLIAVGYERKGSDDDGAVWIADDLGSWQRVPGTVFEGEGNLRIVDVAADPDGVGAIAVGYVESGDDGLDAAVWTSEDGENWVPLPSDSLGGPGDQTIDRLILPKPDADHLPLFIAAGSDTSSGTMDAALWYSSDGQTVKKQTSVGTRLGGEGDQEILSLTRLSPGILAVGYDSRSGDQLAAIWYGQ